MNAGWIGVDLDGTLAEYHGWNNGEIGRPIPAMVERVKAWLRHGSEVRVFTARVSRIGRDVESEIFVEEMRKRITDWCVEHIGQALPITCEKDFAMIELWDDRCVQVVMNTGETVGGRT